MPTIGTPDLVWQIIALLSLPWTAFFLVPYLFKCVMYPHKASGTPQPACLLIQSTSSLQLRCTRSGASRGRRHVWTAVGCLCSPNQPRAGPPPLRVCPADPPGVDAPHDEQRLLHPLDDPHCERGLSGCSCWWLVSCSGWWGVRLQLWLPDQHTGHSAFNPGLHV